MNRQVRRLGVVLVAMLLALLGNLTYLQMYEAGDLRAMAGNQRVILQEYSRERGPILVGTQPVARSVPTDDTLKFLRVYGNGPLYASATGFYSLVYGATGIEKTDNDILAGNDDRFLVDRIEQLFAGNNPRGGAVQLTLDAAAQRAAYAGLEAGTGNGKPFKGAVVAIDPSTGAILAQVQLPSFDPNRLSTHNTQQIVRYHDLLEGDPDQPLLNRPIAVTYPPGSTFKLVVAAAALASGRWTPDSVIPGPAQIKLPGSTRFLRNSSRSECGPDGMTTLQNALAISCNTAFAWLGQQLGADALRAQAEKFGFGTQFLTPQRSATSVFPEDPDVAETMQSAIGQYDVRATALQMAMVGASIGNNGLTMDPYIVSQVLAPDLAVLETTEPQEFAQAMTPEQAAQEMDMMVSVVENGSGWNAQIPGVRVAGKTGTAQTGTDAPPHAWFVGVAPVENPQVAVAVVVENGGGSPEISGNLLAAPIARAVMEAVLRR